MEKVKKDGFFRKLKNSIFNFDSYQEFATETWGAGILYFLKIILLITLILAIAISVIQVTKTIPDLFNYIRNDLPQFSYSDGVLKAENDNKVLIDSDEQLIIVDTGDVSEEKVNEYKDKINLYSIGILVLKDKIYLKSPVNASDLEEISISSLADSYGINNFSKDELVNKINNINMVPLFISLFFAIFIIGFILISIYLILDIIILSLLVNIFAMILGIRMRASACFNIAVHAISLSLVLLLVYQIELLTIGFEIKYFSIMYRGISYIYAFTALILIRSSLIKQKMELTAIIQKQKEIKADMERQEQEKKEKEKDKNKENKKDDKKTNDEKNEEEKHVGNEANGEV